MKFTKMDLSKLTSLINEVMDKFSDKIVIERPLAHSELAFKWNVFHVTMQYLQYSNRTEDYKFMRDLYNTYNDDYITTALNKIIK